LPYLLFRGRTSRGLYTWIDGEGKSMKAKILTIGFIDQDGRPKGWNFNGMGVVPSVEVTEEGILYCGYTIEELTEIMEGDK